MTFIALGVWNYQACQHWGMGSTCSFNGLLVAGEGRASHALGELK